MGTAIAKVMKQVSPRKHQLFLGVPFTYSVTSEDAGLQSKTFGYKRQAVVTSS